MKQIKVIYKSGAVVLVPYSSKFYTAMVENIGKDFKAEHPSATILMKNVDGVVFVAAEAE